MNDRLLKKLILKEIHNVLKEDFEDLPMDYDDDDEEEDDGEEEPSGIGVYYNGDVRSAEDFAADYGLMLSNPEEAIQSIYDSSGGAMVKKRAKLKGGGTGDFYFQEHPFSSEGMRYGGYGTVIIVAQSRRELEDEVGQAQNEI